MPSIHLEQRESNKMEITTDLSDRIDALRYESPTEAHKLALDSLAVGSIPPELAPGIHGALGSVLRMLNDFTGAERAIHWGLHLVKDDPFVEGRLYQRLASVRGNLFDFPSAIQYIKRAATCFELSESEHWKTSTIFAHGRLLCESGRWDEGLDLFHEAHDRFDPQTPEAWRGAVMGLTALAYDGIGKPEEGLAWLNRSREYKLSPWLEIRRTWTEARLRTSVQDFKEAQRLFHKIINFFEGVNNIEHRLAQIELAKCHLADGETDVSQALLHDLQQKLPLLIQREDR